MNPSLHSNSIGLQTILVIWSLTHREGVVLCSLYFAPIIFAIPGDQTPNLTKILITTNHYTPYPKYCPWPRLSHSLMAVCLMFTSWQNLHHAYHTATHLGASCISSLLYHPYLCLLLIVGAGSSLRLQTAFFPCPTAAWHCLQRFHWVPCPSKCDPRPSRTYLNILDRFQVQDISRFTTNIFPYERKLL